MNSTFEEGQEWNYDKVFKRGKKITRGAEVACPNAANLVFGGNHQEKKKKR